MLDNKDYMARLNRSRRRRRGLPDWKILAAVGGALLLLALAGGAIYYSMTKEPQVPAAADSQNQGAGTGEDAVPAEAAISPEEEAAAKEEAEIQAVLDSYQNLGLVQVSGYLNIRETPDPEGSFWGTAPARSWDRRETGIRSPPAAFPATSAVSMCSPAMRPWRRPGLM